LTTSLIASLSLFFIDFSLMSSQHREPSASAFTNSMPHLPKSNFRLPGREQLLLKSPELQSRLGKRHCDESELLPLLLLHGLPLHGLL
jgi:hypothetical protein